MIEEHEANRRQWDLSAESWRDLRDRDGIWQQLRSKPELAFEGGAYEQIRRHLGSLEDKRICVIGSGDNYGALALASGGASVTSVDISEKQLEVAADRAQTILPRFCDIKVDWMKLNHYIKTRSKRTNDLWGRTIGELPMSELRMEFA